MWTLSLSLEGKSCEWPTQPPWATAWIGLSCSLYSTRGALQELMGQVYLHLHTWATDRLQYVRHWQWEWAGHLGSFLQRCCWHYCLHFPSLILIICKHRIYPHPHLALLPPTLNKSSGLFCTFVLDLCARYWGDNVSLTGVSGHFAWTEISGWFGGRTTFSFEIKIKEPRVYLYRKGDRQSLFLPHFPLPFV